MEKKKWKERVLLYNSGERNGNQSTLNTTWEEEMKIKVL